MDRSFWEFDRKNWRGGKGGPAIRLMAHMDEISMIVKRINEDGSLRVDPLGGILPGAIGQCPVDILETKRNFQGSFHSDRCM